MVRLPPFRRSTTVAPPGVAVLDGPDGLAAAARSYERLTAAAPVTARWEWLSAWADAHPSWRPLAVVVSDGAEPVAAALLARRRRGALTDVTALGHGQSDYARFPAATDDAARLLADGIVAALAGLPAPLRVRLDGLPAGDPVLARLADRLPGAVLQEGDGAPVVHLRAGADPLAGRREARVMARRGHNRLRADGRSAQLDAVTSVAEIARVLPALESLHRARDHAVRGRSDLDDPEDRAFWYAVCIQAAQRGELEVSTLRVDGDLASYAVAFLDGDAYRVWDPRISPSYSRYNPGHVLRADLLARLGQAGRFTEFDWMRGVERYKLATTSDVVPTQRLVAWSPGWAHRVEGPLRALRGRLTPARREPAPATACPPSRRRSGVLADLVDAAASGPVLVIGSLPPDGRDLDLLVPAGGDVALCGALVEAGFTCTNGQWLRWVRDGDHLRADVVEMFTAPPWPLHAAEHGRLWSTAAPLPGRRFLRRPAPDVSLLILAHRYASGSGAASHDWLRRVRAVDGGDPACWTTATAHAPLWGVARALAGLQELARTGTAPSLSVRLRVTAEHQRRLGHRWLVPLRAARQLRAPAGRRHVVALSGLDGAGKSSQVALLAAVLGDLGVPVETGWARLSYSDWLITLDKRLGAVGRGLTRLRRPAGPLDPPSQDPDQQDPGAQDRPIRAFRQRHPALTWTWAWVITADALMAQHRLLRGGRRRSGVLSGGVLICDRYALDSAAHLDSMYGATIGVGMHARAVRALLPRPAAAFLLRVDAAEAHRRKPQEYSLEQLDRHAQLYDLHAPEHPPMTVLDGTRDPLDLATDIATQVRLAVQGRPPRRARRREPRPA